MKLALYLPNFRDLVTVKELEDLTALADAVREAGRMDRPVEVVARPGGTGRRGHLRVLPKPEDG